MDVWKRVEVLLLTPSHPFTTIVSPPLSRPPPDPPPPSFDVTIPPPPTDVLATRAPPKPPWTHGISEPSRVIVSKLGNCVSCYVFLFTMFYWCCVFVFKYDVLLCFAFPCFTCAVAIFAVVSAFAVSLLGNLCFQDVNSKAALYMFVNLPQMRWMLSRKKEGAVLHDAAHTNLCNSSLIHFSSKRVFNLDTIETTYSRTELAAVAYLIRNWIDVKTVDSLIFVVMDRVRKTLQARLLVCRCWMSKTEIRCGQGINLWRNSSSDINNELYKGQTNEIASAFDFLSSNEDGFDITVWYKSVFSRGIHSRPATLLRIPRSVNLISNAYLQFLRGPGTKILFEFVKEMPKPETVFRIELASLLGGLFFTWVVLQLFPVILTSLVYEKQQKLRIMMKMHGLGDGPYWLISYGYFLALSVIYILCFVIFGSVLGLKFFTLNDYSIQFVFYFIYVNLQISTAFLLSSFFSNVKTATVTAYLVVFGTGLLACFLFQNFVEATSFPRGWIICMELYPGFSLYRGLYEFAQSAATIASNSGTGGMLWQDLNDSTNGMKEVLIIMFVEWIVVLFVAYYIDQVLSTGSGKSPLFFLKRFQKKSPSFEKPSIQRQGSKFLAQLEKEDVIQEREKVEQLLLEQTINHAIVCNDLKKFYPGRDGNPGKFAVRELFLAVPRGECFGMLGPNGAGKTSFISMMIGLTKPTSGAAYVEGLDIRTHMDGIYTSMGVCPQHDLLWESLTGREHLLFYGRLKNLKGSVLTQAVEESLKNLNLFHGGVADKKAGKYSGGMKRRLSVAISLIGDPKVVYMDEPSTGLDPASRKCLWNVIRLAKQDRAIILTTHSMEEAEALCDRLGIFVDGSLQCVGNPKELKGRYGGTYVFTITTSSDHEKDVENMIQRLTPNANRIYHLSGTQKFELPKKDVKIANVFRAVEVAKRNFTVFAWGLADTTLEDVFIKVAREAEAFDTLS